MKTITYYFAENDPRPYSTEERALQVEARNKEWNEGWLKNNPDSKLFKLKDDLDKAMYIHPETIATCSYRSLQMKAMVKVCQAFAEEYKEYLNHY